MSWENTFSHDVVLLGTDSSQGLPSIGRAACHILGRTAATLLALFAHLIGQKSRAKFYIAVIIVAFVIFKRSKKTQIRVVGLHVL